VLAVVQPPVQVVLPDTGNGDGGALGSSGGAALMVIGLATLALLSLALGVKLNRRPLE